MLRSERRNQRKSGEEDAGVAGVVVGREPKVRYPKREK
jgi:hypothetical protein